MKRKQKSIIRLLARISMVFLFVSMVFTPATSVTYAATTPTKIMPLGDSITDCDFWRTMLFNKLADNGYDVQSVGTQYGNHEGHSGMCVTNLAQTTQLSEWLAASNPDIVMMHFGTNDCWGNAGTDKILDAYTTLVGQMRANNPNMIIVVAQIIPMHPNDTYDGAHPNSSGSQKMCDRWYETLSSILSAEDKPVEAEVPTEPETPTEPVEPEVPTEPEAPEAPVDGVLKLDTVLSTWNTGYTMTVNITNTSNETVNGWELKVNKADFDISNIWCAEVTESGEYLIIRPMSWNATISAGGSVSFGFQGNGTVTEDFAYTLQ